MSAEPEYDTGSLRRATSLLRRGSALVLILVLLALTLVVFASYQFFSQQVHNQAFDRIVPAHEALERQGIQMASYLQRLAAWQVDQPGLAPGATSAADGAYHQLDLLATPASGQALARVWLREDASPSAMIRAASILNLAYLKHQATALGSIWLFDRQGSLFASYPPLSRADARERTLRWSRSLTLPEPGETGWTIRSAQGPGECDCLLAYTRLALPGAPDSLLSQAVPLQELNQVFAGRGWFALLDAQKHVVYGSPGAEPALWQQVALPARVGVSEIAHRAGKIMVQRKLRYLPWTLVYSPSRKGERGREWSLMLWHVLAWLAGVMVSLWGYRAVRRLLLAPNEAALGALVEYQRQLKQNNQQLRVARDQAEQASQARALFLAVMSHEIRTPLNGVMAMLELLAREPLGPEARRELELIQSSSELLLHVISDILDFTRIQSGKVEFAPEPVCVRSLIDSLLDTQRAALSVTGKPVMLALKTGMHQGDYLLLDPYRLRQIVGNLLSNALKFTSQGEIQLHLDHDGSCLQIAVQDSGIGMSQAQLARLFQPFSQAEATTARHYGGSGLGLAIVKGLIDQSGGDIVVESQPGEGSVFRVRLPCSVAAAPEATSLPALAGVDSEGGGGSIWVVEDHPINQATLRAQFKVLGVDARFSSSGAEALENLPLARNVALILTDISMPEMDGYQFTARLKADDALANIPVVALSAHAFAADVERSRQAGMAAYLTKPVRLAELTAVLQRFGVGMHAATTEQNIPVDTAPSPGVVQLPIDDLMLMFGREHSQVRAFVERYLQCDQDDLPGLQQALSGADRPQLAALAHRMGSAALYIDPVYAEQLYVLEETAAEGDWDDLAAQVEELVCCSQAVARACRLWLQSTGGDAGRAPVNPA
jgi:signal transduction histidine kinase/ActR/RegA family two-component response regulator